LPLIAGHPPEAGDPDLGGRNGLVRCLTDELISEFARHTGTRLIRPVVVDLYMGDRRKPERGIG
jgi:hypothetical protein